MTTPPAANLPAETKSRTPTLAPSLPDKLHALVMSGDSPVVGPNAASQLAAFAEQPEPPAAERPQVEVMIGKLAMATAQAKVSAEEAEERLDLYWLALNDIPLVDLRWAFGELVRTSKFLPTPAEIRAVAIQPAAKRKWAKSRARFLAWKHKQEWHPPVEPLLSHEAKALLAAAKIGDAA